MGTEAASYVRRESALITFSLILKFLAIFILSLIFWFSQAMK